MEFSKLLDYLKIYIYPEETCKTLSKKQIDKKEVLIKTLLISLFFNFALFIIMFLSEGFSLLIIILPFILSILTFISIILIEYFTFLFSKWKGGTGNLEAQLNITNTYLVFAFFMVIISEIIVALNYAGIEFVFGIYLLFYILMLYLNYEKIEKVHEIKSTTIPSIVYGILVAISFIFWLTVLSFISLNLA